VAEAARDLDDQLAGFGRHLPGAAMLRGDAAGFEPGGHMVFELASDFVVPAEPLEFGELQAVSFPARTDVRVSQDRNSLVEQGPASEEAIKLGCHCPSFRRGPVALRRLDAG
jgi:hypothetical protein